jgi:serine/threonine-protein kinase
MELAEGETLAERIQKGPIPVDDALPIALQIVEGLEAAHEQGIIHRDLKPANVMLSAGGRVKILDFGLAKVWQLEDSDADLTHSPTLTAQMTAAGVLLGTAAYMSPEQARGKAVDRRADIWAFGCVLYDMLTGRRLFEGETVSDVLAGVLRAEPDWEALPPSTPAAIRRLLRRCLHRDPDGRLHDIADARLEIEEARAASAEEPVTVVRQPRGRRTVRAGAFALAGAVLGGLVVWGLLRPTSPPAPPVTRFTISLPEGRRLVGPSNPIALSPDGTILAYVAASDGERRLFVHELAELEARPLAGTEGAGNPFFSPDGRWVGFYAHARLKRASVAGAGVIDLCEVPAFLGGSWGGGSAWLADGRIVFPRGGIEADLMQVSSDGGAAEPLSRPKTGHAHIWPHVLPDQKSLFVTTIDPRESHLAVLSLDTGELQVLLRGGSRPFQAAYLPSGHLVYSQASSLFAATFDLARREVGTAVVALEGVHSEWVPWEYISFFSVSESGSLAYVPGATMDQLELVWVDSGGRAVALSEEPDTFRYLRLSPDGARAAVQIPSQQGSDIWLYDLVRGTRTPLTHQGSNSEPVWTPDGKRVTFFAGAQLCWMRADGIGEVEVLFAPPEDSLPSSWSPDGRVLAFYTIGSATRRDIHGMNLDEERTRFPILVTEFDEHSPMISPDGRWLAYVSDRSGREEVYVQAFPGPGPRHRVSTEGAREPIWSRDGRELYYRSGDRMMVAVVATGTELSVGIPRALFEGRYVMGWGGGQMYDVSPEGERFLMVREPPEAAPTEIRVVLNWVEELKRLVPTE